MTVEVKASELLLTAERERMVVYEMRDEPDAQGHPYRDVHVFGDSGYDL